MDCHAVKNPSGCLKHLTSYLLQLDNIQSEAKSVSFYHNINTMTELIIKSSLIKY